MVFRSFSPFLRFNRIIYSLHMTKLHVAALSALSICIHLYPQLTFAVRT